MRKNSSDHDHDEKIRKRRQQKRDYAARKRQQEKRLLSSLEMTHKDLTRRSKRRKRQIEQLRAWATYARSYLSLCCQLEDFQTIQSATRVTHKRPLEGSRTLPADGSLNPRTETAGPAPLEQKEVPVGRGDEVPDPRSSRGSDCQREATPPLPEGSEQQDSFHGSPALWVESISSSTEVSDCPKQMMMSTQLASSSYSSDFTTETVTPLLQWSDENDAFSKQLQMASSSTTPVSDLCDDAAADSLCSADQKVWSSPVPGGLLQLLFTDSTSLCLDNTMAGNGTEPDDHLHQGWQQDVVVSPFHNGHFDIVQQQCV